MEDTYTLIKKEIFKYVMANGEFTIPAIAEKTGYSTTTIAQYTSRMKEEGIIDEIDLEKRSRRGRRAVIFSIRSDKFFFIGVDIKPFELTIGLADFKGKPVNISHITNFTYENSHENMDEICRQVDDFIDKSGIDRQRITAISFNIGGRVNSAEGTSASVYNFEETQSTPLAQLFSERLGTEVYIENDTKAMAYGDYQVCGKPEWKNVLYVNAGWGLGLGIIIGGEIYYGSHGFSGEIGHIPVYDNKILCHCGKKGCMETEISGAAIVRKLTERIKSGESSCLSGKIRRGERVITDDIIEAIRKEDPLCIELVAWTGRELGRQLAGLINIFNPDCIMIGGKLSSVAPYYFLQHASLAIRQYSLNLISRGVAVETSKLGEDAGIFGACILARNKYFFK